MLNYLPLAPNLDTVTAVRLAYELIEVARVAPTEMTTSIVTEGGETRGRSQLHLSPRPAVLEARWKEQEEEEEREREDEGEALRSLEDPWKVKSAFIGSDILRTNSSWIT
jgi:hypothetical protein